VATTTVKECQRVENNLPERREFGAKAVSKDRFLKMRSFRLMLASLLLVSGITMSVSARDKSGK